MSYTVYGHSYDTDSELSSSLHTVKFKVTKDLIIRYIRTRIIFYNNPNVTALGMKLYYDEDGEKGDLIATSTNTHTKTTLEITEDNSITDTYFKFNFISLDTDNYYHLALYGTSSSMSENSHIAWETSYPYPIYTEGFAQSFLNLPKFPFDISVIGDEF